MVRSPPVALDILATACDVISFLDLLVVVLLTGADGFLGRAIAAELARCCYEVIGAVRSPPPAVYDRTIARYVRFDFSEDVHAADWAGHLRDVDAVINSAGIFRETGRQSFQQVHAIGPRALFAACAAAGVQRVIQVSALGADGQAASRFHRSKAEADEFLLDTSLSAAVVQPSLVYGEDGASARTLRLLASLPVIPVPGSGRQRVQPIHVQDVAAAIVALLGKKQTGRVALVGPRAVTMREYLAALRQGMGLRAAHFIPIPAWLIALAAALGATRFGLPDAQALAMLERGNTADPADTQALLGHPPRPIEQFIPAHHAANLARATRIEWLALLLRLSIAAVWIVTGVLSFGLYPVEQSLALLARTGVPATLAPFMLYAAATLDLALGIGTLLLRRRERLWLAQALLILVYTLVITVQLPEYWLHPFGPILKNLPLLAAIGLLYALERR